MSDWQGLLKDIGKDVLAWAHETFMIFMVIALMVGGSLFLGCCILGACYLLVATIGWAAS